MDWKNPKSVETTIKRLTKEIAEIDDYFYRGNENEDRLLFAGMLERKRDDMVRSAVLQMHTAIEEILNSHIVCRILNIKWEYRHNAKRSNAGRALRKLLSGAGSLGFDMKLNLVVALGLLNTKTKNRLMILNTMRNRCSHNWVLKTTVRQGKRPAQKKPPLLFYEGRDLHQVVTLKAFIKEYGTLYAKLYGKYLTLPKS
jgi:hypothetical protein